MAEKNFLKSYPAHLAKLRRSLSETEAVEAAVGGEFLAIGKLEHYLLKSLGLTGYETILDIGCGSGRLAYQLASYSELRYTGTDVVPGLLKHAEKICDRDDWLFTCTNGVSIPCEADVADYICFFSVFTHLTHEDTYRYLREAKRALKPGGRIVFSFLEFRIVCHWSIFANSVEQAGSGEVFNQFVDRHAIATWAERLGLTIDLIADGDKPHIPLDEPITYQDGRTVRDMWSLGQSVAVLSKSL